MHMLIFAATALASSELTIEAVGEAPPGSLRYFQVAAGDLDGDGVSDGAVLRVDCARGKHFPSAIITAREQSSGLASGKRQHGPVQFIKHWDKATPLLAKKVSYDVKKVEGTGARASWDLATNKGSRVHGDGGVWAPVDLAPADAEALCAAPAPAPAPAMDGASKEAARP